MARFQLARPPISHEEIFVSKYDSLLRQAQRLASTVSEAEDLVQDAFIRFSLARPDLERLDNLDGYLYAVLRNLHLSRVRRAARNELTSLSILEFDSAESGLRAFGARDALEVRDALRAACDYGCARRISSKAGSLFLLRFFHGAVPTEMARIARVQVKLVDRWLAFARREAQVFLATPERLSFVKGEPSTTDWHSIAWTRLRRDGDHAREVTPADVLGNCRARIFSLRHARCWSTRQLDAMYDDERGALPTDVLAEIVTCPVCLERVCTRLGIHRLNDRFPTDTFGRNQRSRGAPASGRKRELLREAVDRLSEVREHRPRELRLAVNGFVMTSQKVATETTELTLTISLNEPVTLAEVFSEQGECIAFLDVEPAPLGPAAQAATIELSGGRSAELTLTFAGPWPTLRAVYRDPDLHGTASEEGELDRIDESAWASSAPFAEAELTRPSSQRTSSWIALRPVAKTLSSLYDRMAVRARGARRGRLRGASFWSRRRALAFAMALIVIAVVLFGSPASVVAAVQRLGAALIEAVTGVFVGREPRTSLTPRSTVATYAAFAAPVEPSSANVRREPAAEPAWTMADMADAELRVLARLAQVNAYLGQEIALSRSTSGGVTVNAVVTDHRRRETLMASVSPLIPHRPLRVRIETMEEAARRQGRTVQTPTEVRTVELAQLRDALPAALRDYVATLLLESPGADRSAEIDRETRRLATRAVERSQRASRHAWALKHLADRFLVEGAALDADAHETLGDLLRTHAREFRQGLALLKRELQPAYFPQGALEDESASPRETERTQTLMALRTSIDRLLALDRARERAVSEAFSLSAVSVPGGAGLAPEFWIDLDASERLALDILNDFIR